MARDGTAASCVPSESSLGTVGAGRAILIVEDDVPLRNGLARAFEREAFDVKTAATLKETYEIAYDFAPELAVVDLSLRDGHGMELVSHLRDARPGVRIVVITGYDSIASSLVALKAGVIDYLPNPVRPEQVITAIIGQSGEPPGPADRPIGCVGSISSGCSSSATATSRRRRGG